MENPTLQLYHPSVATVPQRGTFATDEVPSLFKLQLRDFLRYHYDFFFLHS